MRRSSDENKLKMWFLMLTRWYRSNEGLLIELYKMSKGSRSACRYPSHTWPAQNYLFFFFLVLHWTFCTKPYKCGCSWQLLLLQKRLEKWWPLWCHEYIQCPVLLTRPNTCTVLNSYRSGYLITVGRMTWATPIVGFVCLFLNIIALLLFLF